MNQYPASLKDANKTDYQHEDFFEDKELDYVHAAVMSEQVFYMHQHRFYEINVIAAGEGKHYIEKQSFDAPVGCVFPLPPGIRHGYYAPEKIHAFHIMIHCAFFEQYARELKNIPGNALLFEIEPYIRSENQNSFFLTLNAEKMKIFEREFFDLLDICNSNVGGKSVMKNFKALYIIGLLSNWISEENHLAERTGGKYYMDIVKSMEYIQMHFQENLNICDLAEMLNMSRSTYLSYFNRICKCTPARYQLECRLKNAEKMLLYSDASIAEIAQECGFYDSSHFIRFFEREKGISPSKFR